MANLDKTLVGIGLVGMVAASSFSYGLLRKIDNTDANYKKVLTAVAFTSLVSSYFGVTILKKIKEVSSQ